VCVREVFEEKIKEPTFRSRNKKANMAAELKGGTMEDASEGMQSNLAPAPCCR